MATQTTRVELGMSEDCSIVSADVITDGRNVGGLAVHSWEMHKLREWVVDQNLPVSVRSKVLRDLRGLESFYFDQLATRPQVLESMDRPFIAAGILVVLAVVVWRVLA